MPISHHILQAVHKDYQKKKIPEFRSGMTVCINQKIREGNKERIQAYQGLIIKVSSGSGIEKTITVRKVVDGIGVERIFPIYSSNIKKLDVIKKATVRRSKLYYLRKRSGKSARLKETYIKLRSKKGDKIEEMQNISEEKNKDLPESLENNEETAVV